jgi:Zn-dependent protease with chaperone function
METTHFPAPAAGPASIPGPVDRVSFFDEQRRRRRQTWRYTVLCALAAALVGVPLAMFITPFLFFITVLLLRLAHAVTPVPAELWALMRELAGVVPGFLIGFADSEADTVTGTLRDALAATSFPFASPLATVALLLLPSMAAVVIVWLGYRRLFRRAGVGGGLLALGAREPRPDDLEEQQLVNVVEEMSIAAGLPAPRTCLIDTAVPNAAAIGSGTDDAVIVVTRGLLDTMDRDATQGVIGHLTGSVGNGDMRIALSITTLFQTIELFFTAFDAVINLSRSAWRDLYRVARLAVTGGADPRAAAAVAALLDHRLGQWRDDGIAGLMEDAQQDRPRSMAARLLKRLPFLYVLLLPSALLYIPFLLLRFQVYLFRLLIIGPMVMLLWRARRYLADATAVQLTRSPDALARALVQFAEAGAVVPGGQWFAHLFVIGGEAHEARAAREVRASRTQHAPASEEGAGGSWSDELAGIASHPALDKRLKRLRALGAANITAPQPTQPTQPAQPGAVVPDRLRDIGLALVLLPLMALASWLMACVAVVVFLFGMISATLFIGLAMPVIQALLM